MTSQKTFSHYIIDRSYKEGGWMKVHHKRKVENMSSNGWVSQTFILEIINYRTLPHTHKSFRKSMRKKWKFYKKKNPKHFHPYLLPSIIVNFNSNQCCQYFWRNSETCRLQTVFQTAWILMFSHKIIFPIVKIESLRFSQFSFVPETYI